MPGRAPAQQIVVGVIIKGCGAGAAKGSGRVSGYRVTGLREPVVQARGPRDGTGDGEPRAGLREALGIACESYLTSALFVSPWTQGLA